MLIKESGAKLYGLVLQVCFRFFKHIVTIQRKEDFMKVIDFKDA